MRLGYIRYPLEKAENNPFRESPSKGWLETRQPQDVTLEDGVLRLEAQRKQEQNNQEVNYYTRERTEGRWARSIQLPVPVDGSKVHASLKNGILKISLEKPEQVKPKTIAIN